MFSDIGLTEDNGQQTRNNNVLMLIKSIDQVIKGFVFPVKSIHPGHSFIHPSIDINSPTPLNT